MPLQIFFVGFLPGLNHSNMSSAVKNGTVHIDADLPDGSAQDTIREAIRRDEELSSGAVIGRAHDEVMQAARRAIGCV